MATPGSTASPAPAPPLHDLTPTADSLILWLVLGLVFLWVAALVARVVLDQLKPVLVFLIAAGFVGAVIVNVVSRL